MGQSGSEQVFELVVQVALLLEGGRQCMIWPEHGGLSAYGEDFVIDPYSQGALYSRTEASAAVPCQMLWHSHIPQHLGDACHKHVEWYLDITICKGSSCHTDRLGFEVSLV